jgi:hypothetical protein
VDEFVMSLEKNNLGRLGLPSHTYDIQPVTVETDEGPTYVSRFVLGPESTTSVRDVMRAETNGDSVGSSSEVSEWLQGWLTDLGGSDEAREIKKAAKKESFSESAVDRAKKKLGIRSKQQGFGRDRTSHWYLPDAWAREVGTDLPRTG